jgi:3-phenylpropionate/cinnamic acid dioxygenase small subunit
MTQPVYKKLWATAIAAMLWASCCISNTVCSNAYGEKKASVESRLQRLEDREEIHQLLMDYGRYLDERDFASFSALFAEEGGEWIGGMGKAKGPKSIRKLMEDTIGSDTTGKGGGPNRHLFTNETIRVSGNEASATTKWIFLVQNSSRQPQPFYVGHYDDTFVRENGRWKFSKRVVTSDIPADDPTSRK